MIVVETITIDGNEFMHTYSDANRYVVRDGISYDEAIDPLNSGRVYTEGDMKEPDEPDETADKAEAYDILMGVEE